MTFAMNTKRWQLAGELPETIMSMPLVPKPMVRETFVDTQSWIGIEGRSESTAITNRQLGFTQALWRGWGMMVSPNGQLKPMCAECDPHLV